MGGDLRNHIDPVTDFLNRVQNGKDISTLKSGDKVKVTTPTGDILQGSVIYVTDDNSVNVKTSMGSMHVHPKDVKKVNDDSSSDDSDKKNASDDELLEGIRDLIEEGVPKDKIVKDMVKESGADEARIRRLVREAYSF